MGVKLSINSGRTIEQRLTNNDPLLQVHIGVIATTMTANFLELQALNRLVFLLKHRSTFIVVYPPVCAVKISNCTSTFRTRTAQVLALNN